MTKQFHSIYYVCSALIIIIGEIDEDDNLGLSDDKVWADYWRELFPQVTVNDIEKFSKEYKGSDEELSDLKTVYMSCKGDMQKIIDSVMVATIDDEQRFRDILNPLIEAKELPSYKKFVSETAASKKKRRAKATNESKEAEEAAKELKGGSLEGYSDLVMALQRNQEKRGDISSYLEKKYASNQDDDFVISFGKERKKRTKKQSTSKSSTSSKASASKRQKKS